MATQFETPEWTDPQLRERLEPHLRRRGPGAATLGDLIAETGLPAERTEPVLRRLLDEYNGRLAVDEQGELVYSFPRGLHRRETWRDTWARLRQTLWQIFKVAYKAGLAVVLVVYFLFFFLVFLAIMVAMMSSGRDSDFDFDGCDGCGNLLLFSSLTDSRQPAGQFQRRGVTPARPATAAGAKIPFWLRVFEFVFGEEPQPADPLAEELGVVAYLRDHQGRLTVADVVALTGRSLDEAEDFLLHLIVAHGGDVEVSDDGTLVYTFDRLMITTGSAGQVQPRRWTWWWERPEQPATLNRNSLGANIGIACLNAFNLAWAGLFTFLPGLFGPSALVWVLTGPLPLAFSVLFFLIPALRKVRLDADNAARAWRNRLRQAARALFARHVATGALPQVAASDLQREVDQPGLAEPLLAELVRRWDAEPVSHPTAPVGFDFARLRQDWRDVVAARRQVDPEHWRVGTIAYDTEDEQAELADEWRRRMTGDGDGHG